MLLLLLALSLCYLSKAIRVSGIDGRWLYQETTPASLCHFFRSAVINADSMACWWSLERLVSSRHFNYHASWMTTVSSLPRGVLGELALAVQQDPIGLYRLADYQVVRWMMLGQSLHDEASCRWVLGVVGLNPHWIFPVFSRMMRCCSGYLETDQTISLPTLLLLRALRTDLGGRFAEEETGHCQYLVTDSTDSFWEDSKAYRLLTASCMAAIDPARSVINRRRILFQRALAGALRQPADDVAVEALRYLHFYRLAKKDETLQESLQPYLQHFAESLGWLNIEDIPPAHPDPCIRFNLCLAVVEHRDSINAFAMIDQLIRQAPRHCLDAALTRSLAARFYRHLSNEALWVADQLGDRPVGPAHDRNDPSALAHLLRQSRVQAQEDQRDLRIEGPVYVNSRLSNSENRHSLTAFFLSIGDEIARRFFVPNDSGHLMPRLSSGEEDSFFEENVEEKFSFRMFATILRYLILTGTELPWRLDRSFVNLLHLYGTLLPVLAAGSQSAREALSEAVANVIGGSSMLWMVVEECQLFRDGLGSLIDPRCISLTNARLLLAGE